MEHNQGFMYLKPVLQDLIGFALFGAHQLQVTAHADSDTGYQYSMLSFTTLPFTVSCHYMLPILGVSLALTKRGFIFRS